MRLTSHVKLLTHNLCTGPPQLGPAGVTAQLGTAARPHELVTVQGREGYEHDIRATLARIPQDILVSCTALVPDFLFHC